MEFNANVLEILVIKIRRVQCTYMCMFDIMYVRMYMYASSIHPLYSSVS